MPDSTLRHKAANATPAAPAGGEQQQQQSYQPDTPKITSESSITVGIQPSSPARSDIDSAGQILKAVSGHQQRSHRTAAIGTGGVAVGQEPREYGVHIKLLACLGLVSVQVFAATVLKLAQRDGKYLFSPQSSLVISEGIKCVLSAAYMVRDHDGRIRAASRSFKAESAPALVINMFLLATIYAVNNALMFWLFARADPGSISLVKSGATIVSAALLYVIRGMRLSGMRWSVLVAQMLGLLVAQFDACKGRPHLAVLTYAMLVVSLINSSIANVWNEFVIKRFEGASLATKNVHLYLFGMVLNFAAFMIKASIGQQSAQPAFFAGYGLAACGVVMSNALMGIAMNVVYKYADAVVKNIATTTTTVVLLVTSAMFFAGRSDVMVFFGTGVVIIGTYLYFSLGLLEGRVSEMERVAPVAKNKPGTQ